VSYRPLDLDGRVAVVTNVSVDHVEYLGPTREQIATDKAGAKSDRRGPNPKGLFILEANGRFSLLTSRSDIPNFAINNVNQGTAEEYKAAMTGMIANVGTWTVDEKTKTITTYVEAGSFPNLNGNTQTRVISSLTADELRYVNGASVSGTSDEATWQRAK